jgi:hypothetical protein
VIFYFSEVVSGEREGCRFDRGRPGRARAAWQMPQQCRLWMFFLFLVLLLPACLHPLTFRAATDSGDPGPVVA